MVDSVAVTHKEDLDAEPAKYQVHFPVDQDRLNQPEDGIDESEDEDCIGSDSSDDSDEEESTLVSIAPESSAVQRAPMIPQVAKKKRIVKVVKNPHGKYVNYEANLLRDRALKLLGYGWTFKDIERKLDIPTSTMSDHYKRYRTRGGNTAPIKQKGSKLSKISQDGSKFLVKTVLEKENMATLQQRVRAYYTQFQIILQPSTICCHLVKKCEITIKRAHLYPELCTDDDTKDMRKEFVEKYIQTRIAKYRENCVFIDEASFAASMRRNYRWSPKGEVTHIKVPKLRTQSKTIIAAISHIGIVDVCVKTTKGGTRTRDFVQFLECVMDELDEQGLSNQHWNLIYDNAPIHTATHIGERITERGYNFIRLPQYSPFLSLIEEFFSKVKLLFRQVDIQDNEHGISDNTTEDTEDTIMEEAEEEAKKNTAANMATKEVEKRLTNVMSAVTLNDYKQWIKHSTIFFDHCLMREDNL
ncbi:hypothetical protein INT45_000782 [Circinella minor]|uniref:Tc1-like transposase DDE domain-containing protein n=1 Tax=Circinella minor TaxID=1195481 RepID=A0A8H7RUS8_9FUNG|nr:hypothetical protein INT45_000782 [Circinella minor]